jgi:hypothetical protein
VLNEDMSDKGGRIGSGVADDVAVESQRIQICFFPKASVTLQRNKRACCANAKIAYYSGHLGDSVASLYWIVVNGRGRTKLLQQKKRRKCRKNKNVEGVARQADAVGGYGGRMAIHGIQSFHSARTDLRHQTKLRLQRRNKKRDNQDRKKPKKRRTAGPLASVET